MIPTILYLVMDCSGVSGIVYGKCVIREVDEGSSGFRTIAVDGLSSSKLFTLWEC